MRTLFLALAFVRVDYHDENNVCAYRFTRADEVAFAVYIATPGDEEPRYTVKYQQRGHLGSQFGGNQPDYAQLTTSDRLDLTLECGRPKWVPRHGGARGTSWNGALIAGGLYRRGGEDVLALAQLGVYRRHRAWSAATQSRIQGRF